MALARRGFRYGASILLGAVALFLATILVFRVLDMFPRDQLSGTIRLDRQHLPAFRLTDQHSTALEFGDLRGRVSIVAPLYIDSVFSSPAIALKLRETADLLGGKIHDVQIVAVSVDPDRDTVERAAAFSRELGLFDRWHYITGTSTQLLRIWKALRITPIHVQADQSIQTFPQTKVSATSSGATSSGATSSGAAASGAAASGAAASGAAAFGAASGPEAGDEKVREPNASDPLARLDAAERQLLDGLSPEYIELAKSVSARFGEGYQVRYNEMFWILDASGRIRTAVSATARPDELVRDVDLLLSETRN